MTDTRTVQTWEQMTLGGGVVRFHSETIGHQSSYWECVDEECSDCYNYEQENNK